MPASIIVFHVRLQQDSKLILYMQEFEDTL